MALNARPIPADLDELDDWTDEELRGFVRRHLRNDDAWTWDSYTNPQQIRRLRKALYALNGTLLDAAREAHRRMTPAEYEAWVGGNRRTRETLDRRLDQVAALRPHGAPAPEPAPPPGTRMRGHARRRGAAEYYTEPVRQLAATGMVDRLIGDELRLSAAFVRKIRASSGIAAGRKQRTELVLTQIDPKHGLPYGSPSGYHKVHRLAREAIGDTCLHCGTKPDRIEAALRPGTPAERLRVHPEISQRYSADPGDYDPLCRPCHIRQDRTDARTVCMKRLHPREPGVPGPCIPCNRQSQRDRRAARRDAA